jgi:hypothetical protein
MLFGTTCIIETNFGICPYADNDLYVFGRLGSRKL